ncbi:MAG: ATP-binding protein [Candidatus Altiarchaeota archaeon]
MKQLTVISGKGGTGKTSLVAAFAGLSGNKVIADCDVDAADLHLLLNPTVVEEQDFMALKTAVIDQSKCIKCGECMEKCRFDAIVDYSVDDVSCEGCGVCRLICPQNAVELVDKVSGKAFISKTRLGPLCHARLFPGEEASGKLVTHVRNNARKVAVENNMDLILIDGSPGTGCPVIASIGGVDMALIVTEPTLSGLHDMERILAVARHFNVRPAVCVNKYDLNEEITNDIEEYCGGKNISFVGKIPYDDAFTDAMVECMTIIEYSDNGVADDVRGIWSEVEKIL